MDPDDYLGQRLGKRNEGQYTLINGDEMIIPIWGGGGWWIVEKKVPWDCRVIPVGYELCRWPRFGDPKAAERRGHQTMPPI